MKSARIFAGVVLGVLLLLFGRDFALRVSCSFAINALALEAMKNTAAGPSLSLEAACTHEARERALYFTTWLPNQTRQLDVDTIIVEGVSPFRQILLGYRLLTLGDDNAGASVWEGAVSILPSQQRADLAIGLCERNQPELCSSEIDAVLKSHLLAGSGECDVLRKVLDVPVIHDSPQYAKHYAIEGMKTCPGDPYFNYRVAGAFLFEDAAEALRFAESAEQLGYDSSQIAYLRGKVYRQGGNCSQAIPYFETARKKYATDPWLLYLLGDCYKNVGEIQTAASLWQDAIALAPAFSEARQALEKIDTTPSGR